MADTKLTLADMRTKVYQELGSPAYDLPNSEGGIIDNKLKLAARRVLRKIGFSGEVILDSITCTAGVTEYNIPDDREVVDVYWGPAKDNISVQGSPFADEFSNIPNSSLGGLSGVYWRSDALIAEMKAKQIRDAHYAYDIAFDKIVVTPAPTSGDSIYYTYVSSTALITDVDSTFEEPVLYLACSMCCSVLANAYRGKAVPIRADGLSAYEKTQEWDAKAVEYKTRYEEVLADLI